jgi:tRNA U38,U39,U40 pseudouridine synthase TruA
MHRQNYTYGQPENFNNFNKSDSNKDEEIRKIYELNSSRNFIRPTSSK